MKAIHTNREIEPELIGGELVRLINETAERTGRRHHDLVAAIRRETGVEILLADGRLNATEEQLKSIAPYLLGIREFCESRTVLEKATTIVEKRSSASSSRGRNPGALYQLWEGFWEHPFLFGTPLMALFAVCMVNLSPPKPSALERAELKARTGRGVEMTNAEADAFRKKQEADSAQHRAIGHEIAELKRSSASDTERAVYRYMRRRFESLGDAYNPDVHDAIIAGDAAMKFGITVNEANSIYYRLDY